MFVKGWRSADKAIIIENQQHLLEAWYELPVHKTWRAEKFAAY